MFGIDKEIFAGISILLAFLGYYTYLRTMFMGRTKPHAFTWVIWGLLTAIAFFAQDDGGAGAGNWVMAFSAVICFFISAFGFFKGKKDITKSDTIFFISALTILPIWYVVKDPLIAVILVSLIDAIAFIPTFRKTWEKPHQENWFSYALANAKFLIAFFALDTLSFTTMLYPGSLILMNGAFIGFLFWRRHAIAQRIMTNNLI